MDRLHITEFGSDEFFRKQRALEQAAAAASQNPSSATTGEPTTTHPSTFVLPVGQSRPPTGKRRASNDATKFNDQKIRSVGHDLSTTRNDRRPSLTRPLAGFRSKAPAPHKQYLGHLHEGPLVEEPVKRRQSFGRLFFSLPNELQVQIISPLPLRTILALRLVCKDFHCLVSLNEGPIVRYHVSKRTIPTYALRLYPLPDSSETTLRYLCGIWNRLYVASRLTTLICEYAAKDMFLRNNPKKREEFEPHYRRMRLRLLPLIFTMSHFFETCCDLHIKHLKFGRTPLSRQAYTLNPIEKQVIDTYSNETLLKVHQVVPLVLSSFIRQLRPPTYLGKIELLAKGYNADELPNEIILAIFMMGGLRQAERFWQVKGYNERRHAIDTWYSLLTTTPSLKPSTAVTKKISRSLFHRKRSVAEVPVSGSSAGHDAASCKEWNCTNPTCIKTSASRRHRQGDVDLIYHGSLSAGPIRASLSKEECRLLLSDLQPLTTVWTPTAEALILGRGIVDNPNKIKKNTAVLTWLISEILEPSPDGLLEEWNPPGGPDGGVRRSIEVSRGVWDS